MNLPSYTFFVLITATLLLFRCAQTKHETVEENLEQKQVKKGMYLGEFVGETPKIFGEGFVSRSTQELNTVFSPDGREIFFTLSDIRRTHYVLCHAVMNEDSTWSSPKVAPFAGKYSDADPMFSPDGKELYFISKRPYEGTDEKSDFDIWKVTKSEDSWGTPEPLPQSINDNFNQYYVSVTSKGDIYYASRKSTDENFDIFKATKTAEGYNPQRLGAPINTKESEGDVFVAPDESYIIFVGRREDSFGSADLYISYRNNEEWTEPQNLGPAINSVGFDYCPVVSHDGQYFFYTSYKEEKLLPTTQPKTIEEVEETIGGLVNGMGNVYWVETKFIEDLKKI